LLLHRYSFGGAVALKAAMSSDKVFTNNKSEAIENKVQGKGLLEYQIVPVICWRATCVFWRG
jgi:hypothetical protein